MSLTFTSIEAWWWPYVFILVAGVLATDVWRWIGVLAGNSLKDDSEAILWVRAVATALIAAVIGKMIVLPSGSAAEIHIATRICAAASGWMAFAVTGKNVLVGVVVAELVLVGGALFFPF